VSEPARGERAPKPGRRPLCGIPVHRPIRRMALARALCANLIRHELNLCKGLARGAKSRVSLRTSRKRHSRCNPRKGSIYIPSLSTFPLKALSTSFALLVNTENRQCKACRGPPAPEICSTFTPETGRSFFGRKKSARSRV